MSLKIIPFLATLPLMLFTLIAEAQHSTTVKGTIIDARNGSPLEAVTIGVLGVKDGKGTISNAKGDFSIRVGNIKTAKLLFSHLSYKSQIIELKGKSRLIVKLEPSSTTLQKLVVIGYGEQKEKLLTGAVSKLENHNLGEMSGARLDNLLVGKISGLSIQTIDNNPGAATKIRVRGASSISANQDPLIVVDGTPVPDGLAFVNPADVASVEVLKDAASSAIYGSRGANGVILITTKEGTSGHPEYTLDVYYGKKSPYKLYPVMTATELLQKIYAEAALREDDPTVPASRKNLATSLQKSEYIIENQIVGHPTNWQKEGLQNAYTFNVQFNISGGTRDLKYYVSANVRDNQGLMEFSRFNSISLMTKLNGNLSKKISFGVNFNPTFTKRKIPGSNFANYYRWGSYIPVYHDEFTAEFVNQNPQWDVSPGDWAQARHFSQPYSGIMPDGSYYETSIISSLTSGNTPLSKASKISYYYDSYRMLSQGYLTYKVIPGLNLRTSLSAYYRDRMYPKFRQTDYSREGLVNTASVSNTRYVRLLWDNRLTYTKTLGHHHLNLLLGYTAEKATSNTALISGQDFPIENFETLNLARQINQDGTYTLKDETGLISFLGRIMYNYKEKYLFMASLRTDGSSYFAKGKKFGWFPSVSAGWIMSKEPFMESSGWVSFLKLRMSYGVTGNNKIEEFAFQELLYPANYVFGSGTGNLMLGLAPNGDVLANPDITWEQNLSYNIGVDLGIFDDKVSLHLDYYNSHTNQLLLEQTTLSFSGSNAFWNNIGRVHNQGIEIGISTTNIKNNKLEWSTDFNISGNRNKLQSLGGKPYLYSFGSRNEIYAAIVGEPYIQYYGYKTDGIWISQAEVDQAKEGGLTSNLPKYFEPGGLKFKDVNKDNKIDEEDRIPLGVPFPDFIWGITNRINYNGFDLSFLIQGSQGGSLIDGDAIYYETKRFNKNFNTKDRWVSAAHPGDGKTPYVNKGMDWLLSDYTIESASYVALRNVILGYSLPDRIIKKIKLNSARVYFSANNVAYLFGDSYRGINIENRRTTSQYNSPLIDGYQIGGSPIVTTYAAGIKINF